MTPQITDSAGKPASEQLGLTGSLTRPGSETTELTFRSCGESCFFSPATWADGTSCLTLTPVSRIWKAKPAALAISWPALPAADLLQETVTAMKSVPAENAVLELTLAPDGRILHETQTAPHHLVTRTLIYPEREAHHD